VAERSDVEFANSVERSAKNKSFEIPPAVVRCRLRERDHAKVVVVRVGRTPTGERIWLRVLGPGKAEGSYWGQVISDPIVLQVLRGDVFCFGPEHVCDVSRGDAR